MNTQVAQATSTSFRLGDDTLAKLRDLSDRTGLTQAAILRLMIDRAYTKFTDGDQRILDLLGIE